MTNFSILNNDGDVIGNVEVSDSVPPVLVTIHDPQLKWVAEYLNRCLAERRHIVGTDGVRRQIGRLVCDDERRTLFSKIESLSAGHLHVGDVAPTGR